MANSLTNVANQTLQRFMKEGKSHVSLSLPDLHPAALVLLQVVQNEEGELYPLAKEVDLSYKELDAFTMLTSD